MTYPRPRRGKRDYRMLTELVGCGSASERTYEKTEVDPTTRPERWIGDTDELHMGQLRSESSLTTNVWS